MNHMLVVVWQVLCIISNYLHTSSNQRFENRLVTELDWKQFSRAIYTNKFQISNVFVSHVSAIGQHSQINKFAENDDMRCR
jgi:hypothetical protein